MVYALEPWISRCIIVKTRRQARLRVSERAESNVHGRPPSGLGRRVEGRTAARRLCSAQPGHAAPGRAFKSPAPARSCPRPHFAFPGSPSPLTSPQPLQPRCREPAIAIGGASSRLAPPSPPQPSTVFPATPCALPCPLLALGKLQPRARARRSSAASPVTVAGAPQSTSPCVS